MPHKAGNGAIFGIVSEDGVPSQKRITLMDRSNLSIVAKTVSDNDGAYAFTGLNPDTDDYLAFAVDDTGDTTKKPIIYDKIRPISAHMGGLYWANWYLLSMSHEPLVQLLGVTDNASTNNFVLTGGAGRHYWGSFGDILPNQNTVTQGAASLPTTQLLNGALARWTKDQDNALINQPANAVTAEWVLDLSTVGSDVAVALVRVHVSVHYNNTDGLAYAATLLSLQYAYTTGTVKLYRHDGTNGNNILWSNYPHSKLSLCCEYVLPTAQRREVVHIAGAVLYGDTAALYVNGQEVARANLASTNTKAGNYYTPRMFALIGSPNKNAPPVGIGFPASYTTGVVAFYGRALSSAQIKANYDALVKDTLPQVTGYVKAVVQDYPSYLYLLNEPNDLLVCVDRLRPNNLTDTAVKKVKLAQLSASTDTIVKGGGGTVFGGGGMRSDNVFASPQSPRFVTVEFIAKPTSNSVSDWQMLISHADKNGTVYFEVRRHNRTGNWVLAWRESGAEYLANFAAAIDISAIHHYVFTVNKATGEARLYIDSAIVETVSVTKLNFDNPESPTTEPETLSIGGRVDGSLTSVSYPYYGYLAAVAIYPFVLTDGQIKAHYDARDTL
ncbi:LamG-like jellyroll fold domain-containing protein [Moraxella atlantae]|uniref:LamG-like jellyroll fold domain-containing protein n=1 Tax=Faucicola atlantae TaxID=34059 RepID=UPI003751D537